MEYDVTQVARRRGPIRMLLETIADSSILLFALSLITMWLAAQLGAFIRVKMESIEIERQDYDIVLTATLTLLGLVIGFSFSMVISRYDQRKNYEEEEANSVGTEYLRVGLLPAADAMKARALLRDYLEQRILFYKIQDTRRLREIDAQTTTLQSQLWTLVETTARKEPTPAVALAVSGMNDVLNSQGYTQAAWWNRLPIAAWGLLMAIALFSNLLIGYGAQHGNIILFLILPIAVSASFFLIADIDSPRHGLIRVIPQNLVSLSRSLQPQ
jgi:hypothetical protein